MGVDIIRGAIKNAEATEQLISAFNAVSANMHLEGTLYLGYPLSATSESVISVDALLLCREKGLVAFVFGRQGQNEEEAQDVLYYQLNNTLSKYEGLRRKRQVAVSPVVITFFPEGSVPAAPDDYIYCDCAGLQESLEDLPEFDQARYTALCEALQKISSMKPKKKRLGIIGESSYGGIIKKIEAEIANLDEWQKKAAFEIPGGPQRIRGLAGSGKTVVLALKAAYLHIQYPDWTIAVTFYTRALSQQYIQMITNFCYEYTGEQPNWERLQILHSWGTASEPGIYSEVAREKGVIPKTYSNARNQYGSNHAFEGICQELLKLRGQTEIYDAILIDEAQDMPSSFFRLCYHAAKEPKRIVFAYDELQSLNSATMPNIEEMFGVDSQGNPLVSLVNIEGEPRQDIVLPICYRNTPWALSLAHALGFGVYREDGVVQLFEDLNLWDSIGYKVVGGELQYGEFVQLQRKENSYPSYFSQLLKPEDAIKVNSFNTVLEEYQWVAEQIYNDINNNELDPDDILVIFPDSYYSKNQYSAFSSFLDQRGIDSILAGVSTDRNTFRIENCITCSSIYRAKGNEAPMVYIVNAEYCADGEELITLRNILFTAITRSRAWVRICGIAPGMDIIKKESESCMSNKYNLNFRILTKDELRHKRAIYRDRTENEKKKLKELNLALKKITESLVTGEFEIDSLPELNKLINTVQMTKELEDISKHE